MSEPQSRAPSATWQSKPVIDWLMAEGRFLADIDDLVVQMGDRMHEQGAPVSRIRLAMRTLHPLTTAMTSLWQRGTDGVTRNEAPHGLEQRPDYRGSPLEIIARTRQPFRRKLTEPLPDGDHDVLHELKAEGWTDYYGLPMAFSDGAASLLVLATNTADGFSDADLAKFDAIASALAPIIEVYNLKRRSHAVADAYLGPRTGRRVLDGQITRGHIEKIDAAILVSDIRNWTGLNNRLAAEDALALANRYFEVIAEAIEAHGGEILKFIGDGVLAIFPVDDTLVDDRAACANALAAARQAIRDAAEQDPPLDLNFGIGMHFGKVLYGNIGSATRIDFTVLGPAVNMAARIEGLCGTLDRPILFSRDLADRLQTPTEIVTRERLKGNDAMSDILVALDAA